MAGEGKKVVIEFVAGDEALNRREEFLYALFVPARASLTMPVMDQPDLKARWTLTLTPADSRMAAVVDGDRYLGMITIEEVAGGLES